MTNKAFTFTYAFSIQAEAVADDGLQKVQCPESPEHPATQAVMSSLLSLKDEGLYRLIRQVCEDRFAATSGFIMPRSGRRESKVPERPFAIN